MAQMRACLWGRARSLVTYPSSYRTGPVVSIRICYMYHVGSCRIGFFVDSRTHTHRPCVPRDYEARRDESLWTGNPLPNFDSTRAHFKLLFSERYPWLYTSTSTWHESSGQSFSMFRAPPTYNCAAVQVAQNHTAHKTVAKVIVGLKGCPSVRRFCVFDTWWRWGYRSNLRCFILMPLSGWRSFGVAGWTSRSLTPPYDIDTYFYISSDPVSTKTAQN